MRDLGSVLVGGAIGSVLRYGISLALPAAHRLPLATLAVNLLGAFALGWVLTRWAGESPRARRIRALFGTGLLGAFTTYSTFALETTQLLADGLVSTALGYALGTVVLGTMAAWAGVRLGAPRGANADRSDAQDATGDGGAGLTSVVAELPSDGSQEVADA